MDKDQYIMDLYDESKFDIEGIKNSEIGSRYKYNLKRRPISRSFIIESGIFHIFNPGEGYKNNLEYIDDVLNLYGFHSVYPRSPEEVAYYYCLMNNMTIEKYNYIVSSEVFERILADSKMAVGKETITVGWIKKQLRGENPTGKKTEHYTQQVSDDISELINKNGSDVSCFLEYIDSEDFKGKYALNRATTTYYFRKYIDKYIDKRIAAFKSAQKKSRSMEYDKIVDDMVFYEKMDILSEELYSKLNDCPLKGKFEIKNDQSFSDEEAKWNKIEKGRWKSYVKTYETLGVLERKGFQEKELRFDNAIINIEDIARHLMQRIGINEEISKEEQTRIEHDLRDRISSVIRGQKDVTRSLMTIIMVLNGETLDEINGILSECGFYIIRNTNEDVILNKMMNWETVTFDDMIFVGLTGKPQQKKRESSKRKVND